MLPETEQFSCFPPKPLIIANVGIERINSRNILWQTEDYVNLSVIYKNTH